MAGVVAASLLSLFYLVPILCVLDWMFGRDAKRLILHRKNVFLWLSVSILTLGVSYAFGSQGLGIAAANLILSVLTLTALAGSTLLTLIIQKVRPVFAQSVLLFEKGGRARLPLASPRFKS